MNKALTLISGLAAGAGLMYFLDPDRGRRRRARVRDQAVHGLNKANEAMVKTSRDLSNRVQGIVSEAASVLYCSEVDDDVLAARVRSKLGRVASHPRAIDVAAKRGRVTLSGPVLASEVDHLLKGVSSVRGVTGVENKLQLHDQAEHVPALQGGHKRVGKSFAFLQANWSPSARLLAGAAGGALVAYFAKHRGLVGVATGTLGLGLLTRAVTNVEMARLIGADGGRGVDIQKTINIAAPVEEVFDFWTHHENFPAFMTNVREVKKTGEGRYHWKVAGPAGVTVEWEGEITKLVPNELIAFRSLPGSIIEQSGVVRFKPLADGDTNIDIRMSYTPPAGALGHLLAMLFGSDPKSELDEDLMRMKSVIETGRVPHNAARRATKAG